MRRRRGQRLKSREEYYGDLRLQWLFASSWLIGLIAVAYWFNEMSLVIQILLGAVICFTAPFPVGELFYSYRRYSEERRRDNERQKSGDDEPWALQPRCLLSQLLRCHRQRQQALG